MLFDHTILLKYNCQRPQNGVYGWLKEGQQFNVRNNVVIEQNVGLYGGPYQAMVGGTSSSGFASVGAFSYSYSPLPDGLQVGRYCSISTGLKFVDSSHPLDLLTTSAITFRPQNHLFTKYTTESLAAYARQYRPSGRSYPVIGNDVWIGANVTLAMEKSIGTGAVIAANSTVTRDVAPYSIVGGNPARVIKHRFNSRTVDGLLQSEWWDYSPTQIFASATDPVTELVSKIDSGALDKHAFRRIDFSSISNQ
ncbi:MAG: hypothetical protein JWQ56_3559 [Pseudarthrobacter sp.]|nr:hypothetical protein [Pseudarthrobacter sp.]